MPTGIDRPLVCPVLVGREACLDALAETVAEVRAGHGHTVLVTGEAGLGKTRLVATLGEQAVNAGFGRPLIGACFEPDRTMPYAPFADAVRGVVAGLSPVEAVEHIGLDVARLLPELGLSSAEDDPDHTRRRVIEGLIGLVRTLAARGPVLCVIEDLHWSDDSSLETFLTLARRLRQEPVLMLGTYREEEVQPALSVMLSELDRGRLASEVRLSPMDQNQVGAMLQATLGLKRPARAALVQQVFELSDGNPFFVEELLRSMVSTVGGTPLVDGDRLYVQDVRLPRTVEEAVRRRSQSLGDPARQLLRLAAVMGRRFEVPVLESLTRLEHPTLLAALSDLVLSQLVVEESDDQFAFRHALTRQSVYAQILVRERRRLHEQVARVLEQRYAADRPEDLAYHFFAASDWAKAAEYAERAGDRAQQLHATGVAIEHYSTAINAIEHQLAVVPAQLLRKRALVHETSGGFDLALADHTAALARAQTDGDATAQCQALLDLGFLWAARDYARAGDHFQSALRLARELGDPAALANALNRLGNWHTNVERPAEAVSYHTEALRIAEAAADKRSIAQTLDLLALATSMLGDLLSAIPLFDRAIALHRELEDQPALVSSLSIRALAGGSGSPWTMARCSPVALGEALQYAEQALRLAQALGLRAGECFAMHCLAEAAAGRGQFGRALEVAEAGLRLADEIGHDQWACALHFIRGVVLADVGALQPARAELEIALEQARAVGSLIWIHSVGGELLAVLVHLREFKAADDLSASLLGDTPATLSERLIRFAQAHLALRQGQVEGAALLLDILRAGGSSPTVDLLHAEILLAQERPAQAEQVLRKANQWAEAHGQNAIAWRLQALLVRVLVALGQGTDAQSVRERAGNLVNQIAATVPESLREEFLRAARRALGMRVARDEAGLSPREQQVAVLLGDGLSNRAIADRLVVGERTIETHVSSILAKLNLTSRAQVAVWVARQTAS